jgi:hypothetical protein
MGKHTTSKMLRVLEFKVLSRHLSIEMDRRQINGTHTYVVRLCVLVM